MASERQERETIAQKRLLAVLGRHGAAIARTIEQKICDAGPYNQRIDPHILNPVRNLLVQRDVITRQRIHGVDWYSTPDVSPEVFRARVEEQFQVYQLILAGDFNARMGQVLEIAVFRALQESPLLSLGGYRQLGKTQTTTKLRKEEPPSIFSGRELSGNKRFDFLVGTSHCWGGIEIKNIREWLYPDRDEIRDLIGKSIELDVVPILIARRIPYVTRRLLATCGCLLWETKRQYYPPEYDNLAGQVRDKFSLGYFDVVVSDSPDSRLHDFVTRIIAEDLPKAREQFDLYRDLLTDYAAGGITYRAFAARVRRREQGVDEDFDAEDDQIAEIPF